MWKCHSLVRLSTTLSRSVCGSSICVMADCRVRFGSKDVLVSSFYEVETGLSETGSSVSHCKHAISYLHESTLRCDSLWTTPFLEVTTLHISQHAIPP